MDLSQAMRVLAAFARHRVEHVLVGSMSMAAQGLVRAARDIDILARLGEAFRFADLEWEPLEVEGVRIRVATPRMLYGELSPRSVGRVATQGCGRFDDRVRSSRAALEEARRPHRATAAVSVCRTRATPSGARGSLLRDRLR